MIKTFKLGAVDWTIEINNQRLDDKECYGYCIYDESKILIQTESDGIKRSETAIEHTLYHEVLHSILDTLGYHDLSEDEKFISQVSLLIHQFERTKQ